ncbi:MAG: ribonuclease R [Kiritimatiellia bacterium]
MKDNKEMVAVQYLFESEPESTWTAKEICDVLGIRGKQINQLHEALRQMVLSGQIVEIRKGQVYTLGKQVDLMTGPLRMVRNGAGFVADTESGKRIWVEKDNLGTALPGDVVTLRLYRDAGEMKGKVIKIVERTPRDVVGTLHTTGKFLYVVPLNPVYHKDFLVPALNGAKPFDRVVVRFTSWENKYISPEGEIVDVIGPADQPSLDTEVVMRQFDLPREFPVAVIDEAEQVASRLQHPGKRVDLRQEYIITIDPASARDFDDAISLKSDAKGNRVLGVHIADVGHFVRPKSALDTEARERGTSIYLVDKVIPMLPEQLSNGVCSLRPDEERLAFTAFITFDAKGHMINRSFTKSRICSKLRLNYEQAMEILEDKRPKDMGKVPPEASRLIKEIWTLAAQLRQNRFSLAALDLEVPEAEIVLGDDKRLKEILIRPYDESHQLIEECMVAANEAVATELWTRGIKILARLHEPPDKEKLEELQANLAILGFKPGDLENPKNLAAFLRSIENHPLKYHAHTLVLRSMKRAVYAADNIGHFGLAKKYYAHFTSPIRRYPDLVLHRQLADFLVTKNGKLPQKELNAIALWTTEREQLADDSSRQLIEIKKFRFLQQQIDDEKLLEYDAVIAKCTNYGVFIDIPSLAMGGLVHISMLSKNFVRFNSANESLSAGGSTYKVGMLLKVYVVRVDFNQRRADFAVVGGVSSEGASNRGTSRGAQPGSAQNRFENKSGGGRQEKSSRDKQGKTSGGKRGKASGAGRGQTGGKGRGQTGGSRKTKQG